MLETRIIRKPRAFLNTLYSKRTILFYTPGAVTMYMSKEAITKAVTDKFNRFKNWRCETLTELYNEIRRERMKIEEVSGIIDSLKICDPAVGSGHFLVSALNIIPRIKSELEILADEEGKLIANYSIAVENDELIVKNDEGKVFEYRRTSREAKRVQKAIFAQKQQVIERSLFGVDINSNSVQMVYGLYGLNDEEIEAVEDATA